MKRLTPKQEKFCQEIVKGKNPSEAYIEAYGVKNMSKDSIRVNANKYLHKPNISLRIENLRKLTETEIKYTVQNSFDNFEKMRIQALEKGDFSTAARIEELKGKLLGFYTEKKDVQVKAAGIILHFGDEVKDVI